MSSESGVPGGTLERLEKGEGIAQEREVTAIRTAREAAGVEFIEENGGEPGVRLRKSVAGAVAHE